MSYKAKHDRIILKAISPTETQIGRIVIPDLAQEKAEIYEVVAVGPGFTNPFTKEWIATQHQVGDRVYCKKAVMHELPDIGDDKYYSTRDNEPLAYFENTESTSQD